MPAHPPAQEQRHQPTGIGEAFPRELCLLRGKIPCQTAEHSDLKSN